MTLQVALAVGGEQIRRRSRRAGLGSRGFGRRLARQPERMRLRLVEVTLRIVGAQDELEIARGPAEHLGAGLPRGQARLVDRDDRERTGLQGLLLVEDPDLGALDVARVVVVHPELHGGRGVSAHGQGDRMRRDREARPRLEIVEREPDLGLVEGDVGAALDVGRAAAGVVDRLAVHGDAHHVEIVGTLGRDLPVDPRDVHAVAVVEGHRLVVHDLDSHERSLALDEAGVHDVVGLDVAAPFVLGAGARQGRVLHDGIHGPAGPRRGETDVVAVDRRRAPVEALALRVADEAHARVPPIRDLEERAMHARRESGRDDRLAVRELELGEGTPGGIVDLGRHLLARVAGAQLRLVGELLERIVVPELHLDPSVERASLHGLVGGDRLRAPATVARDRRAFEPEGVLHGQRDATRPRLREGQVVSVDARVARAERRVVGVADELDGHVLLVAQVDERLPDLLDERVGDGSRVVLVPQRQHEILDARPARLSFLVSHLAQGLGPADLDALDVVGDDDLRVLLGFPDLVVPDLNLDAAVLRSALLGVVRGDGLGVARPLVGDRLGRKPEHLLEVLRDLAGALARETHVVPEDARQALGETLRIGMPLEVDADVLAVPHALEDLGERVDVVGGDLRHAGFEVNRRDDVLQLDGLERLARDLPGLHPIAVRRVGRVRILGPRLERGVGREVALGRLARPDLVHLGEARRGGHQHEGDGEQGTVPSHTVHRPFRQKISGSMVSG